MHAYTITRYISSLDFLEKKINLEKLDEFYHMIQLGIVLILSFIFF